MSPEAIRLACLEIASDNATRAALQDPDKLLAMAERYVGFVTQADKPKGTAKKTSKKKSGQPASE